jgi:hypothetical protein
VRLREASHVLLRDVQGLGGAEGGGGALFVVVSDGGANGPDSFRAFRREHSVCTESLAEPGILAVTALTSVGTATVAPAAGVCPLLQPSCAARFVVGRRLLVKNPAGVALPLSATSVDTAACTISFGATSNTGAASEFNRIYSLALTDYAGVLATLGPTTSSQSQIVIGSTFEYRVRSDTLERSVDGNAFEAVLPGVYDIQVVPAYDVDRNGVVSDGERDVNNALRLAPSSFFGANISIVTFTSAKGAATVAPPTTLANRHFGNAPRERRYAGSSIFVAARNP